MFDGDKWVNLKSFDITKEDEYYVQGNVPLGKFDGKITLQQQVVVYLNKGAFSAQSFISYTENPLMDQALTKCFTNLKGGTAFYMLGTLDFKDYDLLKSLTPTSFTFRVFVTNTDRKMLQLFITTTGSPQVTPDLHLKEPIPSLFQCSLIINTRILFSDILPATLKSAEYKLKVVPDPPIEDLNDDKPWSSIVAGGEIQVLFEPQCVDAYATSTGQLITFYEKYIALPTDEFVFELKNMKIIHGDKNSSMSMIIDFKRDAKFAFLYGKRHSGINHKWSKINYKTYYIQVQMKFKTNLEFKVIGTGPNQLLQLSSSRPLGVELTADIDQKSCAGSEKRLKEGFFKVYKEQIIPQFEKLFDQTFPSISLFALKNILFPDDNLIEMIQAYVPGDLVVFGNFTK
ncbi:hypothetical protein LOD99_6633 [Oopsacas minuta]|uniref:Uncharacterized protein n=1 Tax=Oopsacas minuta TaxID=111878 RepID=A0AAV7JMH6_9METZ|nr:hypothetical protein LOD99_6633 [Oopsacas minuta]